MKIKKSSVLYITVFAAMAIAGAFGLFACSALPKADIPVNVYIDEYEILHWDGVDNVTEYAVSVNGTEYIAEENFLDVFELTGDAGRYEIKVKSCGNLPECDDSDWSDAVVYTVEDGYKTKLEYALLNDGGYEVRAKSSDISGKIIIPEEYNGKRVTSIAEKAFYKCEEITGVIIPDGVTVKKRGFERCRGLTRVKLPNDLTEVSSCCFYLCDKLDHVELPDSVEILYDSAFGRCLNLSHIELPENLVKIKTAAFSGTGIKDLKIPASIEEIQNNPFKNNDLESISVDPQNAFYTSEGNCLLDKRSYKVIAGCKNSVIPDNATDIANYAFSNCKNMKSIVIPGNIMEIKPRAFEVTLSDFDIRNDKDLRESLTEAELAEFDKYGTLSEIVIEEGVTKIFGFKKCAVKEIYIPSTVKEMSAFGFCTELESLTVSEDNPVYKSDGNCIIRKSDDAVILGCKNSVIPDYVKKLGGFGGCTQLNSITIPNGVTEISDYAFNCCYALEKVILPRSVKKIGQYAFAETSLKSSVVLSKEIEQINQYAFLFDNIYTDYECHISNADTYPSTWFGRVPDSVGYKYYPGACRCLFVFDCAIEYDGAGYPFVYTFTYKAFDDKFSSYYGYNNIRRLYGSSLDESTKPHIPLYAPVRFGYEFCGWAAEENGEIVYAPTETEYGTVAFTDSQIAELGDGDTLYAVWKEAAE